MDWTSIITGTAIGVFSGVTLNSLFSPSVQVQQDLFKIDGKFDTKIDDIGILAPIVSSSIVVHDEVYNHYYDKLPIEQVHEKAEAAAKHVAISCIMNPGVVVTSESFKNNCEEKAKKYIEKIQKKNIPTNSYIKERSEQKPSEQKPSE